MADSIPLLIDDDSWQEVTNIATGVFAPLEGFMTSENYRSVVDHLRLRSGEPWPIPITLPVPDAEVGRITKAEVVSLTNAGGEIVAELEVEGIFEIDGENDIRKVFGTSDLNHPGVRQELSRPRHRVGGRIRRAAAKPPIFQSAYLSPEDSKKAFAKNGWRKVVGFQTRNPPHRAHEYLQRVGMELMDGIFIQPLLGWKKADDFSPLAITGAYGKMIEEFYPKDRALLGSLMTPMRYAGPREAIFHAIIRRNHGCTHFIVGRDHAGVGNYYGKYEAQELCRNAGELGIEILPLCGPYYCSRCEGIVTEKTCSHGDHHVFEISGTEMRAMLSKGVRPPSQYMRPEISDLLIDLAKSANLFCG